MATDTKLEMGFLEKLGEKFSSFGDGVVRLITSVMGSSNERFIRKIGFIVSRRSDSTASKPTTFDVLCSNGEMSSQVELE